MANNGNNNGNGGRSWGREWWLETSGLFVAEFASMAVSVGTFTFLGELAPNLTNRVSKVIAKTCVEPFLDTIEWGMQKSCKLKECQPDFTKSRHERAEQYAKYLTLFAASLPLGIVTEMGVRMWMNKILHVKGPPGDWLKKCLERHTPSAMHRFLPTMHDLKVVGIDRGIHLGAIIGVNTIGSRHADDAISALTNYFHQSFGWPKDRSKRAAEMLVVYEAPNWVGFGAAAGYLAAYHHNMRSK